MYKWACGVALLGALAACGASAGGVGGGGGSSASGAGGGPDGGAAGGVVGGQGGDESMVDAGAAGGAGGGMLEEISSAVTKVDLLFMIDNSVSMSDKQEILRLALPDLVNRLVNPLCVDAAGNQSPAPAPGQPCPPGQSREFSPVDDINIGVVSSSLGDVGAEVACPRRDGAGYRPDRVDMAHLMGSLPRSQVQGDTPEGFLAWRAGMTSLEEHNRDVQQMVQDVGESGCGWEASLESWYRFLVDPYPYRELARVQCPGSSSAALNCVQQATDADDRILLDEVLLAQRAAFLRPDSLLAVVMLTDENDCSLQVGAQTWVVVAIDDTRPMFRGSSACASDPNTKCCYSCPLGPPPGCAADPICNADPANDVLENRLPPGEDGLALRCYQQKRRFGVDFLYPVERYVNALSQLELCWNAGDLSTQGCDPENLVQNPLYTAWDRRRRVFLIGTLGVPWQAISSAIDSSGRPLSDPSTQLRFKNAAEMSAPGDDTWAQILGSPGTAWRPAINGRPEVAGVPAVAPSLPQMIESELPRAGVSVGNLVNGREFDTSASGGAASDLQYACIFPLPEPRDCAGVAADAACDCFEGQLDKPLCEQQPGASTPGTVQYYSKAYPAVRQLAVLKAYGANSVVTSICARNVSAPDQPDFGYRPAAAAIIERVKERLASP